MQDGFTISSDSLKASPMPWAVLRKKHAKVRITIPVIDKSLSV
jgi:hypothetical protein